MCKLKTHSGTKKRFRMTGTGKIIRGHAYKRHNMRKRSKDALRSDRGTVPLKKGDAKLIKKFFIPYGLK